MSSTNITHSDSKAVGTDDQICDKNKYIKFNVQVVAVSKLPGEPVASTNSLDSQSKSVTEINSDNAKGESNTTRKNEVSQDPQSLSFDKSHPSLNGSGSSEPLQGLTTNVNKQFDKKEELDTSDVIIDNLNLAETPSVALKKFEGSDGSKLLEQSESLEHKECSFYSIKTHPSLNSAPGTCSSETNFVDSMQELSTPINDQFNEEEAGTSGIKIDIPNLSQKPIVAPDESNRTPNDLAELQQRNSAFSIKIHASVNITSSIVRPDIEAGGSLVNERETAGDNDSFVTIEGCLKEKTTSTDVPTIFSANARTQEILLLSSDFRDQPPPPYSPQYSPPANQGTAGHTPVYQPQTVTYVTVPQNASRAPAYRRGDPDFEENLFQTKEIRNRFVRRVYMILALQLLFTFGFITLCIYEEHTKAFVMRRWEVVISAMVILMIVTFSLLCYMSNRRIFPLNFILLSVMTLCMAYMLGYTSCYYKTNIVMLAMGCTAGICLLLSLLAWQRWFDLTGWGIILCMAMGILMAFSFVAAIVYFITRSDVLYIVYSGLITLLMCVYLMYDTQQILGGGRVEMSPEEYILGAITLYIDIVVIFQHLLFLMGRLCSN